MPVRFEQGEEYCPMHTTANALADNHGDDKSNT